jgi:hypothetical protein
MALSEIGFCIVKGIAYISISNRDMPNLDPSIGKKSVANEYAFEPKALRQTMEFILEQLDKYDPETQGKVANA